MWKEYWDKCKVMKFCTSVIRLKVKRIKKKKRRKEQDGILI